MGRIRLHLLLVFPSTRLRIRLDEINDSPLPPTWKPLPHKFIFVFKKIILEMCPMYKY